MARISFRNGGIERAEGRRPYNNPFDVAAGQAPDFVGGAQGPTRMLPKTKATIERYLILKNKKRFMRLKQDFAWLQEEMVHMDLNPEDARFLL
jgi:hypothetical protein